MSTTDPYPNPNPNPQSGWASRATSSPVAPNGAPNNAPNGAPNGLPPVPPRNSAASKARTIFGGIAPRLIATAVVLALAYGAYWFFVVHKNKSDVAAAIPATGTCFSWSQDDGATVLPCSDATAVYKAEGSSTASETAATTKCDSVGAYVQFQITSTRRNNSESGTICAALNLKVGDCAHDDAVGGGSIIACSDAIGDDVKVLSLEKVATAAEAMSDSKAVAVCPSAATQYLSDTVDTTIVCVGKP